MPSHLHFAPCLSNQNSGFRAGQEKEYLGTSMVLEEGAHLKSILLPS
jgi:hypothetical protein